MDQPTHPGSGETAIERLERLRSESVGHRVVSIPLLKGSGHLVVDHRLVQEVFSSQALVRPPFFRKAFGEGLLLADGDRWAHSRRVIQPALSASAVRSLEGLVDECVGELLAGWAEAAETGRSVPLVSDIASCVLRITVRGLFGFDTGRNDPRALSVVRLTAASNELAGLGVFDPRTLVGGRLIKALQSERADVESLARELIEKRRGLDAGSGCPEDLLGRLLEPSFLDAKVGDGGCPVGERGLLEEIVLLLLASVETTTASTANALQLIGSDPACARGIRSEARSDSGDDQGDPDAAPFVHACFREALRLRPPVWFNGRFAVERVELSSGHVVEPEDHVYVCPYLLHRDPDLWPEPDRFLPDRFTDAKVREGASYMPFGLGRHYCVGSGLATLIATRLLAGVLANHDVVIDSPPDKTPGGGFLLGPSLTATASFTPLSGSR